MDSFTTVAFNDNGQISAEYSVKDTSAIKRVIFNGRLYTVDSPEGTDIGSVIPEREQKDCIRINNWRDEIKNSPITLLDDIKYSTTPPQQDQAYPNDYTNLKTIYVVPYTIPGGEGSFQGNALVYNGKLLGGIMYKFYDGDISFSGSMDTGWDNSRYVSWKHFSESFEPLINTNKDVKAKCLNRPDGVEGMFLTREPGRPDTIRAIYRTRPTDTGVSYFVYVNRTTDASSESAESFSLTDDDIMAVRVQAGTQQPPNISMSTASTLLRFANNIYILENN